MKKILIIKLKVMLGIGQAWLKVMLYLLDVCFGCVLMIFEWFLLLVLLINVVVSANH